MNYAPEPIGCGRYSGELGAWLAEAGMTVEVVTAPPHYPGWSIKSPYRNRYAKEVRGPATVWRCPLLVNGTGAGVARLLSPLTLALTSAPVAIWRGLIGRPDAVLLVEPTLAMAPATLIAARLGGAKAVLHVQDLEVDAALAVGHMRLPGWVRRIAFAAERFLMRRFDRVVTISDRMAAMLVRKGVDPDRIEVIRNWVDVRHIRPVAGVSSYRTELGIPDDMFVVLYSGQIGMKQSLHLLLDAAASLKDVPGIRFVVAGDGPAKAGLAATYGHLPNLTMIPIQPEERLNDLLALADLHALPQDPAVADLVLPSKIGGMLASGRRIVVTAAPDSEIATFLGDAAVLVEPAGLADAICREADRAEARGRINNTGVALAHTISAETILSRFAAMLVGPRVPRS